MASASHRAVRAFALALALAPAAAACSRDRPPPDRPTRPTLAVGVDPAAPTAGRRVVARAQIGQPWHTGAWAPASITLSEVAAGDAIVALGGYWGDLPADASTAPSDDRGDLRAVVDQGPGMVGRRKPPVFTQLYLELDAAPGAHVIVPPWLGGPAGDGTLYVAQLRGLTARRLVTSGQVWVKGDALPAIEVATEDVVQAGDLVIALAAYDNTEPTDHPALSHPPRDWQPLGVQPDARNNVPSEACARVAEAPGAVKVGWTWKDPKVNVAGAVIAALR